MASHGSRPAANGGRDSDGRQRQESVAAAGSLPVVSSKIHDAKIVISSEAEGRVEKSVGGGGCRQQCTGSLAIDSSTRSLRSLGRNDMVGGIGHRPLATAYCLLRRWVALATGHWLLGGRVATGRVGGIPNS